jgi:hypothetical protein
MPNSEIVLAAMLFTGVIIITAIASKSSSTAEFSLGKDGIRFRFDGQKSLELFKIDQSKIQDDEPVPPSLSGGNAESGEKLD